MNEPKQIAVKLLQCLLILLAPCVTFAADNRGVELRLVRKDSPAKKDFSEVEELKSNLTADAPVLTVEKKTWLNSSDVQLVSVFPAKTHDDFVRMKEQHPTAQVREEDFLRSNGWKLVIKFNERGAGVLKDLTKAHQHERLAIVVDGRILMAPIIAEPIERGEVWVSGVSQTEIQSAAYSIISSLPAPLICGTSAKS